MVAYNFKTQFADAVASGEKTQTIRADRKTRHANPGEPVQLYTGMRTANCRKLVSPDPVCVGVEPVTISVGGVVTIGDRPQSNSEVELLAKADGFYCATAFVEFFRKTHGLPFKGVLIKWKH